MTLDAVLAAENIVTRVPNRGVLVARPSVEDIREIYRVRRYLEPAALLWGFGRLAGAAGRRRRPGPGCAVNR